MQQLSSQFTDKKFNDKLRNTKTIIETLLNEQVANGHTVVSSTKFDFDSAVFLHLITSIDPDIPVIWVDTGYNRRDTLAFVAEATDHLSLNVTVFKPKNHTIQVPPAIDDPAHGDFAETVKLAPFREGLKSLGASHWISSVRAYQTPNRKTLPTMLTVSDQLTKVHPMLDWSEGDMLAYRSKFALPLGPEAYDPTKGGSMGECGLHKPSSFF